MPYYTVETSPVDVEMQPPNKDYLFKLSSSFDYSALKLYSMAAVPFLYRKSSSTVPQDFDALNKIINSIESQLPIIKTKIEKGQFGEVSADVSKMTKDIESWITIISKTSRSDLVSISERNEMCDVDKIASLTKKRLEFINIFLKNLPSLLKFPKINFGASQLVPLLEKVADAFKALANDKDREYTTQFKQAARYI